MSPAAPSTSIERARAEHAAGIARVHVTTWRHAYRGLVPAAHLASLDELARAARWRDRLRAPEPTSMTLVALDEAGEVAGFVDYGVERDAAAAARGEWEIRALYVDPARQRGGAGRALVAAALVDSARAPAVRLWVLAENANARAFYERVGFVASGEEKRVEIGGVELRELRYARRPARGAG